MTKSVLFRVGVISFATGVFLQSFFEITLSFSLLLVVMGCAFYLISQRGGILLYFLLSLIFISGALGLARMDIKEYRAVRNIDIHHEQELYGEVVSKPEKREKNTRFIFNSERYGRVLIFADHYPTISYGDTLRVRGTLSTPENFEIDKSGRVFNWKGYLSKDDIYYQMFYPEVSFQKREFSLKKGLFSLRDVLTHALSRVIPEPESSLASGLLVGEKHALGEELESAFRKTGIIHIVVLSGYNVTLIADSFVKTLQFLPVSYARFFSILGIVLFALLTGGEAPVVRASILALIIIGARYLGRRYNTTQALFLAFFLMLIHNPALLVFDPSFQLSFLASIGLLYIAPHIDSRLSLLPNTFQIRSIASATLATQIFVLPLLLYTSGEIPLFSIPVNILILLFIPLTMLFSFFSAVAALVLPVLAGPFSLLATALLSYELFVVKVFGAIPFAALSLPKPPFIVVFLLYALLLYITCVWNRKK